MTTTAVFLPGESHGQRSLVGYRPWGRKESAIQPKFKDKSRQSPKMLKEQGIENMIQKAKYIENQFRRPKNY